MSENLAGKILKYAKLWFIDLDGVIRKDEEYIGGRLLIDRLSTRRTPFYFISNETFRTRHQIVAELGKMNVNTSEENILTAAYATSLYLKRKYGSCKCYLIGENAFKKELLDQSHQVVRDADSVDYVVVGTDRNLTYEKIDRGVRFLLGGAELIAAHRNRFYTCKQGLRTAAGPIVAALEYASKKKATSVGKPEPFMFRLMLEKEKISANLALMIGDQLEVDVRSAEKLGMSSVLVDAAGRHQKKKDQRFSPTLVVRNIDELARFVG